MNCKFMVCVQLLLSICLLHAQLNACISFFFVFFIFTIESCRTMHILAVLQSGSECD